MRNLTVETGSGYLLVKCGRCSWREMTFSRDRAYVMGTDHLKAAHDLHDAAYRIIAKRRERDR